MSWRTTSENHEQGIQGEKDLKFYKTELEEFYGKSITHIISKYDEELCKKYNLDIGGTKKKADNGIVFGDHTIQLISLKTLSGTIGWERGGVGIFKDFIQNIHKFHEKYKYSFSTITPSQKEEFNTKIALESNKDLLKFPNEAVTAILANTVKKHIGIDIIVVNPKTKQIFKGEPNWFQSIRDGKIASLIPASAGSESTTINIDGEFTGICFRLRTTNATTIWLTGASATGRKSSSGISIMIQQPMKQVVKGWKMKQKS